jgi:hypothetical protein
MRGVQKLTDKIENVSGNGKPHAKAQAEQKILDCFLHN